MILLGSTGSIGVNTLKIAKQFSLNIEVMAAGRNIELLNQQLQEFNPKLVIVANKDDIEKVNHPNVKAGEEAVLEAIKSSSSKIVVNAYVGFTGLKPTITAIKSGKKVALANKESLVVAGMFIDTSNITPIDSEHFGLWYLMQDDKEFDSLIVTASGGSFRDYPLNQLSNVSIKEALAHPNWSMGNKITIDSATMTNKLFEILEAKWLFKTNKIDALIETKSIIHALVNFKDGSTTAQIANADMRLPIAYALMDRVDQNILEPIDLVQLSSLEFRAIEANRYPIWDIKDDILDNSQMGVVVNAANEVAVAKFLDSQIGFLDISKVTLDAYKKFGDIDPKSLEDIYEIDKEVREYVG